MAKDKHYHCKRCGMDTLSIVTSTGYRTYTCGTKVDKFGMLAINPTPACNEIARLKKANKELVKENKSVMEMTKKVTTLSDRLREVADIIQEHDFLNEPFANASKELTTEFANILLKSIEGRRNPHSNPCSNVLAAEE